ncbi:hypothetical protein K2173_001152 [Erythroxylum novogranatense]|uniref:TF-B3 domain-containing protein n=1 Tax=Erythroxylum novogranatense TaxID=1862640 RepID=A0AAV8TI86_9ROSI|nr:hypothetical protein K2173_001152 [Erythroxylum novogranatense]
MVIVQDNALQAKRGSTQNMDTLLQKKTLGVNKVTDIVPLNSGSHKRKRVTDTNPYSNDQVKSAVSKQAQEVQASLSPQFPSMIKCMLPSHVTGGFWLGLPARFCEKHLPKQDSLIVLEDEKGMTYNTKYLVQKTGLSGGWRGFSIVHNLVKGDVLVFHLFKPTTFKVYIVRVNGSEELDAALSLQKLNPSSKQMITVRADNLNLDGNKIDDKHSEALFIKNHEECIQSNSMTKNSTELKAKYSQSENESGITLSASSIDFKKVKCFEDFDVIFNGLVLNSELSKHLLTKYYELCCSQNSYLHDQLLEGLNCKLVAGVIAETINIAEAIRASNLTCSPKYFPIWEKTLKSFQLVGMNVGFLMVRLGQIMSLADKSKRYQDAKLERDEAEQERRNLWSRLAETKEKTDRLNAEIKALDVNPEKLELMFREFTRAPW